jgi:hypothetical protein
VDRMKNERESKRLENHYIAKALGVYHERKRKSEEKVSTRTRGVEKCSEMLHVD